MPCIEVDETDWPLVVQTFDGEQTDEDVAYFERRVAGVVTRGEAFVMICYIREYTMDLAHIDRFAAFTKQHRGAFSLQTSGSLASLASLALR